MAHPFVVCDLCHEIVGEDLLGLVKRLAKDHRRRDPLTPGRVRATVDRHLTHGGVCLEQHLKLSGAHPPAAGLDPVDAQPPRWCR